MLLWGGYTGMFIQFILCYRLYGWYDCEGVLYPDPRCGPPEYESPDA
jgi:hypothetical protein